MKKRPDYTILKNKKLSEFNSSDHVRNKTLASVAGKLTKIGLNADVVQAALIGVNNAFGEPLSNQELESTVMKIPHRYESEDGGSERVSPKQIIQTVENSGVVLFHDQNHEPFCSIYGDGKLLLRLESKQFRRWLSRLVWTKLNTALTKTTADTVIQILQGKAIHDGNQYTLSVRTAWSENSFWYDLGDGRAVKVTTGTWSIEPNPPILFIRYGHQQKQTDPLAGGNIKEILPYLNIRKGRKDSLSPEQLLCIVFIIVSVICGFAHPLLVLFGREGSAKTTFAKVLKAISDPSILEVSALKSDQRELVQALAHHWFIAFDNVSYISEEISDLLCRAITGEGVSKRALYTDDDDVIYSFRRVLCVTGVNVTAQKSDLLDRSILINLERVKRFGNDKDFWEEFNKAKPRILGAVFSIISKAMEIEKGIIVPDKIRMSDFARWGCAITQAMGYSPKIFLKAYTGNLNRRHQEAIESNLAALALQIFMENKNDWTGQPTTLLKQLKNTAENESIDTRDKSWPKHPSWLWRRLNEARTNLLAVGLIIKRKRAGNREITIHKRTRKNDVIAVVADPNPEISDDTIVSIDSIFGDKFTS